MKCDFRLGWSAQVPATHEGNYNKFEPYLWRYGSNGDFALVDPRVGYVEIRVHAIMCESV